MLIGYKSDRGRIREINEDSLSCLEFSLVAVDDSVNAGLFVVADGMGGHNAGEVASRSAVKYFVQGCLEQLMPDLMVKGSGGATTTDTSYVGIDILKQAIAKSNSMVYNLAKGKDRLDNMGSTLVGALVIGQDLYVASVGDSRCYIINDRGITQVTKDQSLVQEMVDAGLITTEQARIHPRRNVIDKVVGYYPEIDVHVSHYVLYDGDRVLLCSDGLWGMVTDKKIKEIILKKADPQRACDNLIKLANDKGGTDNITIIIIRLDHLQSWHDVITAYTRIRSPRKRKAWRFPVLNRFYTRI